MIGVMIEQTAKDKEPIGAVQPKLDIGSTGRDDYREQDSPIRESGVVLGSEIM